MNFKNRPNKSYDINGKIVWESRSVAVNAVIMAIVEDSIFVLSSERGEGAADYQGLENVVAGYLDWDETGTQAVYREAWEETGLNLMKVVLDTKVIKNDLVNPWSISTKPKDNKQNISLRYGIIFKLDSTDDLPKLTTENNEVVGESKHPKWLNYYITDMYKWAFNHDKLIMDYYNKNKVLIECNLTSLLEKYKK